MNPIEPEEFAKIVHAYSPALVLYARGLCSEPEDVVQEALLKLLNQRPPPDCTRAWLYRTVRNLALNTNRNLAIRSRHLQTHGHYRQAILTDADRQPAEYQLDAAQAAEALEQLPSELREIVTARLWGELTFAEIAEITNLSLSTAFRRYEEALHLLRHNLGDPPCQNKNNTSQTNRRQNSPTRSGE